MIKVFFKDCRDLTEIQKSSVQIVIYGSIELDFFTPEGKIIVGFTPEVQKILSYQLESSIFSRYPFNVWNPLREYIELGLKLVKPEGYIVVNGGIPHYNLGIGHMTSCFRGAQILYPYLVASAIVDNTQLYLIHDLMATFKEKHMISKYLTVTDYLEHFFIFSKKKPQHTLHMKNVLACSTRIDMSKNKLAPSTVFNGYCFHESTIRYLIQHLSKKGDWLLDPMAGTGIFAKVADALGRNTFLCEIDKNMRPLMEYTLKDCEVEWYD